MAGDEKEYRRYLREQGCCMEGHGLCMGAIHVHHAQGGKGLGTRNSDVTGKPLCALHHTQRHALSGPFKGWDKATIRAWERDTAERYRRLYLGLGESDSLEF
jgi:hypothetical protein